MKFKIPVEKIQKAVSITNKICGSNLTLPILNNILIEAKNNNLILKSTNLEIGIQVKLPLKLEKEGKVTIPARILNDFLLVLDKKENIELEEKNNILVLKSKNYTTKIKGEDPEEFPILPEIKNGEKFSVILQNIIDGLSQIIAIPSIQDTRIELSGVFFDFKDKKLNLVATDSIRLGCNAVELEETAKKNSFIIPQRAAREVVSIFSLFEGSVEVIYDSNQVLFQFLPKNIQDFEVGLITKLIEGEYPNWEEIVPQEFSCQATIKKEEIEKAVRVVSLFSSRIQDIKLNFQSSSGKINISAGSSEIGEGESIIEGKIEGRGLELIFNWRYLLDGISMIKSSELIFGINNSQSPAILKPVGSGDYFYILMPKTI